MKQHIRNTLRAIILLYATYTIYFVATEGLKDTHKHCGQIVSKSTDEVIIKHGTNTRLYLNIESKEYGFRSIRVTPTTYFQNEVGNSICFEVEDEYIWTRQIHRVVGFSLLLCIGAGGVLGLGAFLVWDWVEEPKSAKRN